MGQQDIRTVVREKYGSIAEASTTGCCTPTSETESACCTEAQESSSACCEPQTTKAGCCTDTRADEETDVLGYSRSQKASLPEGADLGLGCGNPIDLASPRSGDTVLDLGSGAGIDCFLAADAVGPQGRVIGVDMTPSMIDKARSNIAKTDHQNVEFRLGEIEHLPVSDQTINVIISNCVINLSIDKTQVFREAFRVLRPGGRLAVSDLVVEEELPESVRSSVEAYCGCVAGAMLLEDFTAAISQAGFVDVTIVQKKSYLPDADVPESIENFYSQVLSAQVTARRP